jgi:hypothetical protein
MTDIPPQSLWPDQPPESSPDQPAEPPGSGASWRSWVVTAVVTAAVVVGGVVVISRHGSGGSSSASAASTGNAQNPAGFQGRGSFGASGKVVKIDGSTLTVQGQDQSGATKTWTLKTSSDTDVTETVDGSTGDLKVGDNVVAFGSATSDGVEASTVSDQGKVSGRFQRSGNGAPPDGAPSGSFPSGSAPSGGPSFSGGNGQGQPPSGAPGFANGGGVVAGKITSIDGSKITVKSMTGETKVITTTSATKVTVTKTRTLGDVHVGDTVRAMGETSGDVVTARSIQIGDAGFGPGAGFQRFGSGPGAGNGPTGTTTN